MQGTHGKEETEVSAMGVFFVIFLEREEGKIGKIWKIIRNGLKTFWRPSKIPN